MKKRNKVHSFVVNTVYPGNISREQLSLILGFDPGPENGKIHTVGYVTKVDKINGIITVSTKKPK